MKGLNPMPESQVQSTRAHITSSYENQWGILSVTERQVTTKNTGALLEGKHMKSHLKPLTLAKGSRDLWGLWLWGKSSRESCQDLCLETLYHTADAILLAWRILLIMGSAWENEIPSPSKLTVTSSCGAQTLLRSQLPGKWYGSLSRLRWCQWLSFVTLEFGSFLPPSHKPDRCSLSRERSASSTLPIPDSQDLMKYTCW